MKSIYDAFVDRELFASLLIAAVSRSEAFLFDVMRMVLSEYPRKLSISTQGNRGEPHVPLPMILQANSLDDLLGAVIDRRLNAASYGSPKDYFTYFNAVTGIAVDLPEFDSYVEIKATRDLLVHNSGVVNGTYLEKVGKSRRAKAGKVIPIDRGYYDQSIAVLKKLAGLVSASARDAL